MTKRDTTTKPVWQTWWGLAGPRLPSKEVRVGLRAVIGPLTEEQEKQALRAPAIGPQKGGGLYVSHLPPRDIVTSLHRLQIDLEAVDEDEAIKLAGVECKKILTSLSLSVPEGDYFAELRMLRKHNASVQRSAWSEVASFVKMDFPPKDLEASHLAETEGYLNVLEKDGVAKSAHVHLVTAWQLAGTPGSRPLAHSTVLHFFLCVEAIVQGVMVSIRSKKADRLKMEAKKFSEEFWQNLDKIGDKSKAIQTASTKLREITLQNTIPGILATADNLGLTSEVTEKAIELFKFRSSNLGHPGASTDVRLLEWLNKEPGLDKLCPADEVARSFFKGYCAKRETACRNSVRQPFE